MVIIVRQEQNLGNRVVIWMQVIKDATVPIVCTEVRTQSYPWHFRTKTLYWYWS